MVGLSIVVIKVKYSLNRFAFLWLSVTSVSPWVRDISSIVLFLPNTVNAARHQSHGLLFTLDRLLANLVR